METPPEPHIEASPKPIFKVTLMRHEEPYYQDVGHDLKPEGIERAKGTGMKWREAGHVSEGGKRHLIHSPKPRAKGTLEFFAEGAGIPHESKRASGQLRMSDIPDRKTFMARVEELKFDQEAIAKDHYTHPMHEERPDVIEPHSSKKKRLYRALEYLIRSFDKTPQSDPETPHVVAVSHFEIVTHLIDDVFGIENIGRYNAPAFGEVVEVEAYKTNSPEKILLKVTFDGRTKNVYFNRKERSVEVTD